MPKSKLQELPPLSRAQRELMELVWDQGELGVQDATSLLNETRPVARNTVRTLMERMREKGWLKHRVDGRSYLYSATVPREESLGQRVHLFLFVKVREKWTDDPERYQEMGLDFPKD